MGERKQSHDCSSLKAVKVGTLDAWKSGWSFSFDSFGTQPERAHVS
jgi:hypothetical protein